MNDDFLHRLRRDPDPDFAARLAKRLDHLDTGAAATPVSLRKGRGTQGHIRVTVTVTAAVMLSLVAMLVPRWLEVAQPVNAQSIIQRASTTSLEAAGVHTYHIKARWELNYPSQFVFVGGTPVPGVTHHVTRLEEYWGAFPDRWRIALRDTGPTFTPTQYDKQTGSGSDGTTMWSYNPPTDPNAPHVTDVQIGRLPPDTRAPLPFPVVTLSGGVLQAGMPITDISITRCRGTPTIVGEATVAGRATYVIDLGPDLCSAGGYEGTNGTWVPDPPTPPEQQGRQTMWVDKQWYAVLKTEHLNVDGSVQARWEVTEVSFNQPLDAAVFAVDPPYDLLNPQVTDLRPQVYRVPKSAMLGNGAELVGLVYPPTATP